MSKHSGSTNGFPKIAAEAKLKRVVMCERANLVFEDLSFSPDQYAQLERWRKGEDVIRITLEQVQGSLLPPPGKDKGMAATVAETENEG